MLKDLLKLGSQYEVSVCVRVNVKGCRRTLAASFETLTLVPYDRNLIDLSLLTPEEIAQIDAYHARVLAEVGPDLDGADLDHLRQTTEPLA